MNAKYIRVASDFHLEAYYGRPAADMATTILPEDSRDAESILALAGDISSKTDQLLDFLKAIEHRFARVLYIPGNHEAYRHDYAVLNSTLNLSFGTLENTDWAVGEVKQFSHSGCRFILGTLWGDGGATAMDNFKVETGLNDFRVISLNGQRFHVDDMKAIHKAQKAEIDRLLRESSAEKSVVISHHLPSRRLVSTRFWPGDGSDGINGGFASNCDDILAYDHAPALWIHGHTHDTIDTVLWKTRIVANPKGYPREFASAESSQYNSYNQSPVFIEIASL